MRLSDWNLATLLLIASLMFHFTTTSQARPDQFWINWRDRQKRRGPAHPHNFVRSEDRVFGASEPVDEIQERIEIVNDDDEDQEEDDDDNNLVPTLNVSKEDSKCQVI